MNDLKIAVILGSTRPGRNGESVARWIIEESRQRPATYELVDLRDFPLPHLDEPVPPSAGRYHKDHTKAWAAKIAGYDGFVFVTPEYNHSTSGVLKNAIDFLYAEWNNKAAALVGYGANGGTRAVEHLRGVLSEVQVAHVRQALAFSFFADFKNYSEFTPAEMHRAAAQVMFDQLERWAAALRTVRQDQVADAA